MTDSYGAAESRWLSQNEGGIKHSVKDETDLIECEWCADFVPEKETLEVEDIGYRHEFDKEGNMVRVGEPFKIKSRICNGCLLDYVTEQEKK